MASSDSRSLKDGASQLDPLEWADQDVAVRAAQPASGWAWRERQARQREGSIVLYRKGFGVYAWIVTPEGLHFRWVDHVLAHS